MGLEELEINLSKEDLKNRKAEEFIITALEEVRGAYGIRWKISLEDEKGYSWCVFVNEKQIKKLIMAFGRDLNKIKGQKIKFEVKPVMVLGQPKETIEIII
jgi:hypothetical protein